MKKYIVHTLLAAILSTGLAPAAFGEVSTSGWYTIPETGTGVGVLGATFAEDLSDTMDGASFVRFSNDEVCDSVSDPDCAGGYAQMLLPACEVDDSSLCIEGLSIGDASTMTKAKFFRTVGKNRVKGNPAAGIPNGFNSSLWTAENRVHAGGTNTYAVYAQYRVTVAGKIMAFRVNVTPYVEKANLKVKELTFKEVTLPSGIKGIEGNNSAHGCAWTEDGVCGEPQNFADGAKVEISLKINKSVAGFLNGRLQDPEISLTPSGEYQKLVVKGSPVFVQKAYAKVLTEKADTKILSLFTFQQFSRTDTYLNTYTATDNDALQYFDSWLSAFPDKADSIRTYWGFASAASSSHECLKSDTKILGLVTTNAMVYDSKPPVFEDGELRYRVAGVHSRPDGTDFKGIYDLVIESAAARCLYKYSNAPISASVSVTSSSGGEQSVATTVVNEKNGWFHLGAYGFGFSSPTLKVKFTQEAAAPAATASPTPASSKKTITCVKGKASKKVTATNPKCPSGYKKKA